MSLSLLGVSSSDSSDSELELSTVRHQPEGLDQLQAQTKFTKKELQSLYRGFKNVSPHVPIGVHGKTDHLPVSYPGDLEISPEYSKYHRGSLQGSYLWESYWGWGVGHQYGYCEGHSALLSEPWMLYQLGQHWHVAGSLHNPVYTAFCLPHKKFP